MLRAFEATPAENRDRQRRRVERRYQAVEQCNDDISAKKSTLMQTLQRRDAVVEAAVNSVQVLTPLAPDLYTYSPVYINPLMLCKMAEVFQVVSCTDPPCATSIYINPLTLRLVTVVFQALETRRLLQTKQSLADYVALEKAVCERRLQQLGSVTHLPPSLLLHPPHSSPLPTPLRCSFITHPPSHNPLPLPVGGTD